MFAHVGRQGVGGGGGGGGGAAVCAEVVDPLGWRQLADQYWRGAQQ